MKIGILALQGGFAEHESILQELGAETFQIRQKRDLIYHLDLDGLILPGGESTVIRKLLDDLDLFTSLQELIRAGLPTFGTCAGLILLAKQLEDEKTPHLAVMDISVKRNAYGRQLGSFFTRGDFKPLGEVPMTFIRGPIITRVGQEVSILSEVEGYIVAAQQGHLLVTAYHPELSQDYRIHAYFLKMCQRKFAEK